MPSVVDMVTSFGLLTLTVDWGLWGWWCLRIANPSFMLPASTAGFTIISKERNRVPKQMDHPAYTISRFVPEDRRISS